MAKIKHHGLRKPDDPDYDRGYTISTVHGFRRIKDVKTSDNRATHETNVAGGEADVSGEEGTGTPGTGESFSPPKPKVNFLEMLSTDEWDKLTAMVATLEERRKE
jgi:hypothetical protein